MNKVIGTIDRFGSERKTSKAGKPFNVYTVDVDGQTYEVGFKPLNGFSPGDTISFMSEVKYGKNAMDPATVQRASAGASAGVANVSSAGATSPAPNRPSGGYVPKPFPIPKLHGDRAIVRQNSLTNAVKATEILLTVGGGVSNDVYVLAEDIIKLAYKFEEYSTGDREAKELEDRKGKKGKAAASDDDGIPD